MFRYAVLLPLFAAGCVTSANFAKSASTQTCQKLEECYKASFEQQYSSQSDCVRSTSELADCYRKHCETYNQKTATQCISDIATAECSGDDASQPSPCNDVWSDCNDFAVAACATAAALD